MLGVRRLFIIPAVLGAIFFAASLQFGSAPVKAGGGGPQAGSPTVTVGGGGGVALCSNGYVATIQGCSVPIAPYSSGYSCPPQCPVYPSTYYNYASNFFYSYNYPTNWQFYVGASWQWCVTPGNGAGWVIAGAANAVPGTLC